MIKRLFTYIAAMMMLAACSDDIFYAPLTEVPDNGEIPVAFTVPEMTEVATRALNESSYGDVYMLIYDGPNGKLIQEPTKLPLNSGRGTITIPDKKNAAGVNYRKAGGLYFVFYTNVDATDAISPAEGSDISTVEEKFNTKYMTRNGQNDVLTMTGAATLSELLQYSPVRLYHNAAKVTVIEDPFANPKKNLKFEYEVYGTAGSSAFLAGTYNYGTGNAPSNFCGNKSDVEYVDFGENGTHNIDAATYVHPTLNKSGENLNKSYVIVRSKCSDTDDENYYYYCLQFQTKEDKVLDILPNHHYEFRINTDEIAKGYLTQEAAAENPIPLSSGMFILYDHSPEVYNIITDGTRSLGVSYKVLNTGSNTSQDLYVKLYSTESGASDEYQEFFDNYTEYIKFEDDTWVSLGGISKVTSGNPLGTAGPGITDEGGKDGSTDGVIYKITCNFTESGAGSLATVGTVIWQGLSRKFEVEWDRSFNPEDLYDTVTAIFTAGTYCTTAPKFGTTTDCDADTYFHWIGGELNDDGTAYDIQPKVWGVDATSNNGDPRDQGFHFPMKGGGTATYTITLNDLGDGAAYSWYYYFEGDAVGVTVGGANAPSAANTKENLAANAKPTFTLSGGNDNYNYGVANLVIGVEKLARDVEYYRIPLYHTGFFMKSDKESGTTVNEKGIGLAKALETGRTWTYYEVVSITRGSKTYRMLDRNLGAHSAEMYVEATGDVAYAGNKQAAGGYYRVAGYEKEGKPIIKKDEEGHLTNIGAPKGFAIPYKEVFDDIRNSSDFSTASVGTYYTAVYAGPEYGVVDPKTNKKKRKNVYFPKARYLGSGTQPNYVGLNEKQGDSRAGYYWTATASSGLEKEDVGAWLDCFTLSGSSTSYTRGEVYCGGQNSNDEFSTNKNEIRRGPITGYAMPVRLVLSDDNSAGDMVHETNFFVKGATHVFLYTLDSKGNRTALTPWPGYSICSESDAKSDKKFNFRYESKVNASQDLYAIFNYKTTSGAIFSMSYDATDNKKAYFTNDINPNTLIGYNLGGIGQRAYYYDSGLLRSPQYDNGKAPDVSSANPKSYGVKNAVTITKGCTWSFAFNTSNLTKSEGGIGESATVETPDEPVISGDKTFRIYWYYKPFDGNNSWFKGLYMKFGNTEVVDKDYSGYPNTQTLTTGKYGFYQTISKPTTDLGDSHKIVYFEFTANENFCTEFELRRRSTYGGTGYQCGKTGIPYSTFELGDDGIYSMYFYDDSHYYGGIPSADKTITDKDKVVTTTKYRIYWPYSSDWNGLNVWNNSKSYSYVNTYYSNTDYNNGTVKETKSDKNVVGTFHKSSVSGYAYWEVESADFDADKWEKRKDNSYGGTSYSFSVSNFSNDADGVLSVTLKSDGSCSGGGPTATPVDNYTYKLHGGFTSSNWGDVAMSENGGIWSATIYVSQSNAGFGIKKLLDGEQKEWICSNSDGSVNLTSSGNSCKVSGTDFKLSSTGTYTFKYNPSTMMLYVTKDFDGVLIEGDYNLAYSGNHTKVYAWNGGSNNGWPGSAFSEVMGIDGKIYKVYKVEEAHKGNIIFNGSGDQTATLTYSDEYIMNDNGATSTKMKFVPVGTYARRKPATAAKAAAKSAKTPAKTTAARSAARRR